MKQKFELTCDVIVVGGGTAGVTAAVTASQQGLDVILVESQLSLTGTMANALVTPMMPTHVQVGKQHAEFVEAMESTSEVSLRQSGQTTVWFSPEVAMQTAEQQCLRAGVRILYQTTVYDLAWNDARVTAVYAQSFNQKLKISPKMVVDATGDALLPRLANCEVASGDEHGNNQAISFRFELGNVDILRLRTWCSENKYTFNPCDSDAFFEFVHVPNQPACGILGEIFAQAVRDGVLTSEDIRYIQGFTMPTKPGCLSFNGPQIPKSDLSQTPMALSSYVSQGREMQQRLWQFLRQTIPGFEKSFIAQEARMLGIRESYRIHGKYELSADDYRNRQKFEDGIARGDWYIDIHRDDESVEDPSFKAKYAPGEYYEIPYRSLVIEAFTNYIAVGRHISCDFAMQSSIRIQATCQMMGEAAGIATKISKTEQIQLNQIDGQKIKKILEENQA